MKQSKRQQRLEAKREAEKQSIMAMVSIGANNAVLEKLNNPTEYGFNKIFELKSNGNKTYSIYQPILKYDDCAEAKQYCKRLETQKWGDKLMENHLLVYRDVLGVIEAAAFNFYTQLESNALKFYKNNMGSEPFKPFESGGYRMNLLVIQSGKKVTGIHPMFDASWDKKRYEFVSAYGDKIKLPHLLSLVARSIMAFLPISRFNPNAKQNLIDALSHPLMLSNLNDGIVDNWIKTYDSIYEFKNALIRSRKSFTSHNENDLSNLWRVLD